MAYREMYYRELENFIVPIQTTIDLNMNEYNNFFSEDKYYRDLNRIVFSKYNEILPYGISGRVNLASLYSISYTPHQDGYDFRLHPVTFINNIFKALRTGKKIPFIDLDNKYGLVCFDEQVHKNIDEIMNETDDDFVYDIMQELLDSLKRINQLYYVDINELLARHTVPKDVLLTLAYKSLYNYSIDNDEVYSILPYNYYHKVSDMSKYSYPHQISLYGVNNLWFDNFRANYESKFGKDYVPNTEDYKLDERNVIIGMDILRPGTVDRELTDMVHKVRSLANVDYNKFIELFEKKVNFYKQSPVAKVLQGKYGLNGYMGFAYRNEYLVFDKFYNSDTIDPSRRTILTHGEAIYALPSDQFGLVAQTKQDIIDAKEVDDRIKKVNHNETFIQRIEPIIYGPNVSYSTLDKEIERYKTKMLISKK